MQWKQLLFVNTALFLASFRLTHGGISDARFQKLFRVDLSNVTRLPWMDWVKKHAQTQNGFPSPTASGIQRPQQIACQNGDLVSRHTSKGACCDVSNDTCDSSFNLQCINYRCTCRIGTFFNETTGQCDRKNGKQLTESCMENVDNCYTAYSTCLSGVCQCMAGFKPDGLECVPLYYRCPYGNPLMTGDRPSPCDVNESGSTSSTITGGDQCPSGYECIFPPDPYRPKFKTLSGIEKGYCCPLIPDLTQNILFQDQCYQGDWVLPLDCPPSTHVYAFAISSAPLCCPKPCRPNYQATIINGQCLEGLAP